VACRAEKRSAAGGRCSDVFMAQRSKKARKKRSTAGFFGNRKRGCAATRSLLVLLLTCKGFFCISGWFCFGYRSNSDTSAKRWRAGLKNGALQAADAATFLWRSGRKKQGRSEAPQVFLGTARGVALVSLQSKKTKRLKFLFLCDIMCSRIKG